VIEISHDCAVGVGCVPGDSPGFPVTVTSAGSYRLTSNLEPTGDSTTAIDIQADDVSIDLAGFAVLGPSLCSGTPVTSCSSFGSGIGIRSISNQNVAVRNGTVRGMPAYGIRLTGGYAVVEGVRAISNTLGGIFIESGLVRSCVVRSNLGTGINVNSAAVISDSRLRWNGGDAMATGAGSLVIDTYTFDNGGFSLRAFGTTGHARNTGAFSTAGSTVDIGP
jgi:hypothetical protein